MISDIPNLYRLSDLFPFLVFTCRRHCFTDVTDVVSLGASTFVTIGRLSTLGPSFQIKEPRKAEKFELRSDGRLPHVTFPSQGKSWLPWQPPGVHLRLSKFPSPR